MVRAVKPRSASAPTTTSSATSWLPMMTRSGARSLSPISVTSALGVGIERRSERVDRQKTVGLGKSGDRAGAFAGWKRDRTITAGDQRHQHEFFAAELGRDPHRYARRDGFCSFLRQPGAGANERRDESVKGENRRGRKSRQHDQRLVADHRQAQRLAGFERHAVNQNAGRTKPRDDAMRQVAGAFRGAAGEHHDVAGLRALAHSGFERDVFVRKRAERHWFAASLDDGGRKDGAVAVIDAAGAQRVARLDQFVAGRQHRDARAAHHIELGEAAGRQHADLARADLVPRRSSVSPRAMSEPA